ncbi:MAG TPA: HDIG domain-containing protein [Paludibacteraceae bacterium]|nr:HDIG domain-containing protein [Paludibacteraceae bacterium]
MKLNLSKSSLQNIFKILLGFAVVIAIVLLFPKENKFNYDFEIGKPWNYELLTAPFNFPVYKSEEQVVKERNEILKNYIPYYILDTTVYETQLKKLLRDNEIQLNKSIIARNYLIEKLQFIYSQGIISSEDYNNLLKNNKTNIYCILPSRVSQIINIDKIYTPQKAYEEIVKNSPEDILSLNLQKYLVENLRYDSLTSELSKEDLLKNLSLTSGMVQRGERIIDKGEIVTPETYAILHSLKIEFDKRNSSIGHSFLVPMGEIIIIVELLILLILYLNLFRPRIFEKFNNLLFIAILMILIIGLTSVVIRYTTLNYYLIPFALLPIIVRVFFDSRTALFVHIITILIISLMVDNPFQFVLLQITAGMVAVSSLKDMTQRSQLAQTAFYIFLSYTLMYIGFEFITEKEWQRIDWMPILYFAVSCIFLLFAYLLIYIFEKIFGLISAITLVELTNINSDFMMKFAEVAPGTFQHSLQVSNLATEAAKKINANSLLVRTGALYHDIGKMVHPEFFSENQMGNKNPLLEMDYEKAARTIIQHVIEGIKIAKKNHLPEQIINFIATHHGTSKTRYFYNSFINQFPDIQPNEAAFTYPGPLPNNKETAILMMADAVEATSRSLNSYSEENIEQMVEDIINGQINEGQFRESPISFRDVETVKAVFKEKIKNIYHSRIPYPEVEK